MSESPIFTGGSGTGVLYWEQEKAKVMTGHAYRKADIPNALSCHPAFLCIPIYNSLGLAVFITTILFDGYKISYNMVFIL
ncbi:hypothetical protein CBFG_04164 [Clostridiales bacterium 1_7_47FAA]|nr:hypothetical protein CBFG_04164 [Clostridiales bacterium 1_7_47FAA]